MDRFSSIVTYAHVRTTAFSNLAKGTHSRPVRIGRQQGDVHMIIAHSAQYDTMGVKGKVLKAILKNGFANLPRHHGHRQIAVVRACNVCSDSYIRRIQCPCIA
jgi:hypothetical protein